MADHMNVREVAAALGIHENTVRNMTKDGRLPAIRLPGSGVRRFRREDIERMRREMWEQFAPATEMPAPRRHGGHCSTCGDYHPDDDRHATAPTGEMRQRG